MILSLTKLEKANLQTILEAAPNCPVQQKLLAKLNKPPTPKKPKVVEPTPVVLESGQVPTI